MHDYKFNIGDIIGCRDWDKDKAAKIVSRSYSNRYMYNVLASDGYYCLPEGKIYHFTKDMVPRFTVTVYADEDNNIRIVESGESGVTAAASAPTFENAVHKAMDEFLSKKKHKRGIESVDENDIEMDMLYWCVKSDKDEGYVPVPMIWDGNDEDKTNRDTHNMYHSKAAAEEKIRQLKLIV